MIIKSMSRKEPSFDQLLAYVTRDATDARYELHHNLMSRTLPAVAGEFQANTALMAQRKNGVMLYHEILSITRTPRLTADEQKTILRDIALDYLKRRAPQCLAFATLHQDHKDHLHYHFVITANAAGDSRRHRLSREQFRAIQTGLEAHVLARYPQLEQTVAMDKRKTTQLSDDGHQVVRRGKRLTKKETVTQTLHGIFTSARDEADLFKRLTDAGFELYARGSAVGVRDLAKGTRHRLDTLGLTPAYTGMRQRIAMTAPLKKLPRQTIMTTAAAPEQLAANTPAPMTAKTVMVPPAQTVAPLTAGAARAAELALKTVETAEKVVAAAATHGGDAAEFAVGGTAREATGIIETAVATIGGPKPYDPAEGSEQTNMATSVPPSSADSNGTIVQTPAPKREPTDFEKAVEQNRADLQQMRDSQKQAGHRQAGPQQTR